MDWSGHNNWLVPPPILVSKVIRHCVTCKAFGTLVVPKWPSAPFWPLIFKNCWQTHSYISDVLEFTEPYKIFVQGSDKNSIFGSKKFSSNVIVARIIPFDVENRI